MCLRCHRTAGVTWQRGSQSEGKSTLCELKDCQRSEQRRRRRERDTAGRLLRQPPHVDPRGSPVGHPRQNQAGHLEQNIFVIKVPYVQTERATKSDRRKVDVGGGHRRYLGCRPELQVEAEKLTCRTEVMFTLIMLVMNWEQANKKSEHSRCDFRLKG